MFIVGDIFKINGIEYRIRFINKYMYCWLERVALRSGDICLTGGINIRLHIDELRESDYLYLTY